MKKIKNYLKIGILLAGISSTLVNCNTDDLLSEKKTVYKTVSIEESTDFLIFNKEKTTLNKTISSIDLNYDSDLLSYEPIINSTEYLVVIPATTKFKNVYSRILLVKQNDTIKSVLFNMIPKQNSQSTLFTGKISITDLSGIFINGFNVDNGRLITQFRKSNAKTSNKSRYSKTSECDESLVPDSEFCNNMFDEVFISGSSSSIGIQWLFTDQEMAYIGDDGGSESWDSGGSGGGESLAANTFIETLTQLEIKEINNPIFFVNCASFEYYKPPGSLIIAAAVDNMAETFYSMDFLTGRTIETDVHYNRVYFSMPSWRRNGEAANITAEAVTFANNATQAWYILNPNASAETVSSIWRNNMNSAMTIRGGQFSTVAPFAMRNGSDYLTSLLTSGNCD